MVYTILLYINLISGNGYIIFLIKKIMLYG